MAYRVKDLIEQDKFQELIKSCNSAEDLFSENGLIKTFVKDVVEASLNAEIEHHLQNEKVISEDGLSKNKRNGSSAKTIQCESGKVEIDVPRDRDGTFDPIFLPKERARNNFNISP